MRAAHWAARDALGMTPAGDETVAAPDNTSAK
jgi:hypothetical protein